MKNEPVEVLLAPDTTLKLRAGGITMELTAHKEFGMGGLCVCVMGQHKTTKTTMGKGIYTAYDIEPVYESGFDRT